MTNAQEIARHIVRVFQEAGDPVTNLKLQKLLYYVQGWHLALRGHPAFGDRLEAWIHGPVQPGVYGVYKGYRWTPISDEPDPTNIPLETLEIINSVIETYGGEGGYQLELRTHQEPPWTEARGNLQPDRDSNVVISVSAMQRFFAGLAANAPAQ